MKLSINQRTRNITFFLCVIILFSSTGFIAVNTAFTITDNIYDGIVVGDISVGGLSIDEAKNKIVTNFNNQTANPIISLTYKTQTWPIKANDIDLEIDADNLARQAYNVGRNGNVVNRLQERYVTVNRGYTIPLALSYNQNKLQEILSNIADDIYIDPQNASLVYQNSNTEIQPEKIGYKVDLDKTLSDLIAIINTHIPVVLQLTVNEVPPKILSQDLVGIDSLLSVYTTQFNPNDKNRSQNITLATKNINKILVRPGEIFSFNNYVGKRLEEYGYKEAPAFIDGKLVLDWGGGVCQVSSTLYNAALLADMGIEERTSHFRPPGYVPLGQDAAVADNLLDFRFRNTTTHNIYIMGEISNNEIIVHIFGKSNPNTPDIRIIATNKKILEPNTIIKQDSSLELGREIVEFNGEKGFQVTTYRIKSINGQEIEREQLAFDEFKAEDRIVRIGTKMTSNQTTK